MTTADILLAAQNEKLSENWHGVLHHYSVDDLHDLRINLRRIQVLLVCFKDFWPAQLVKTTEKKIKKLSQVLGPLRDRQEWLAFLESVPNGHLMTPAQLKRADEVIQRQAQRILRGPLAKDVLVNIAAMLGPGQTLKSRKRLPEKVEAVDENLRRLAKNRLDKILNKAAKWSAVDAKTPMPKVHALRRQVRRARYLMEMLALILPRAAGPWARLFRKMVLALGAWHDMTVMQERLAKLDNAAKTAAFMKEAGRRRRKSQKDHQRHWREWRKAREG